MTRKQMCSLASVTAMLFLTGLSVWQAGNVSDQGDGGPAAILTASVVMYLIYLFSALPGQSKTRK